MRDGQKVSVRFLPHIIASIKSSSVCLHLGLLPNTADCFYGLTRGGRFSPMTAFRRGGRSGGFHIGAEQVGQGKIYIFGDHIKFGAVVGRVPHLMGRDRLGKVFLQLPQIFERECLDVESSPASLVS